MLTDSKIRSMKPVPGKRLEVADGANSGLILRVTDSGAKSWVYRYRLAGSRQKLTIGPYPSVTLAEAREEADKARALVAKGIDPAAEKRQAKDSARAAREAERASMTVAKLCSLYLDLYAKQRKRSWREDERQLHVDVAPTLKDPKAKPIWDNRKAKDITRSDVQALLDGMVARGAPVGANRMKALLSRVFRWALAREHVEANPVAGIELPAKEDPKDRVLSEAELRAFWTGMDSTPLSAEVKAALRMILTTGQRPGEVAGALFEEFSEENGRVLWTIPGPRRKSKEAHVVPLSPLAQELIGEWKGRTGPVFVGPRKAPLTVRALSQAVRRNLGAPEEAAPKKKGKRKRPGIPVASFSPHDLRRSAATLMTNAGVSGLVKPLILGHAPQDITKKVYDLYDYLDEKARALDAWGRRLKAIVTGEEQGKVIQLRTTAR